MATDGTEITRIKTKEEEEKKEEEKKEEDLSVLVREIRGQGFGFSDLGRALPAKAR
ncbi:MAG: hypothetical protein M3P27_12440 [Acidobacteriota bacterium]|nr:hypothetical protein [Acidobacteriota bacterium]